MLLGQLVFVTFLLSEPPIISAPQPGIRVEKTEVPGGGELITYFQTISGTETPFVSILKDTLGDSNPANDELRDVWTFTYSRPSIFKRALAAVPFLYRRVGSAKASGVPPPMIDMAEPAKGTVPRLLGSILQSKVVDPLGMPFRATTRAYRSRSGEYRTMNLWRTLDVLSAEVSQGSGLSQSELERVQGRLLLSKGVFGGLVQDRYVVPGWNRFESNSSQARGHNWELLRQRAEDNHLYFQPLDKGESGVPFAMLWMDASAAGTNVRFDSKFLGISDPFRDTRARRWKGYTETWSLDESGARIQPGEETVRSARMIPLALYGLDHPRVPLLIVDFRDPGKPWRREMIGRAADDVATGVLGWTGFGHWSYLAAKTSWSFVHGRHGAALDRSARLRAYVQLQNTVLREGSIDPDLQAELVQNMDKLSLNPFDSASRTDQENARRQYAALLHKAANGALAAHLTARREHEADVLLHSKSVRSLHTLAATVTLGIYRHHEEATPELLAVVDKARRIQFNQRYLEQVLAQGPRPEVVADMARVRRSLDELAELTGEMPLRNAQSEKLFSSFSRLVAAESSAGGQ